MYARRPDGEASVDFFTVHQNNESNADAEFQNGYIMELLSRMTTGTGGEGHEIPPINPTPDTSWSVHSPETRTVFNDLRVKLKDIDALYRRGEVSEYPDQESVLHDIEVQNNRTKLQESVNFFKRKIKENFETFIAYQNKCNDEQAFLAQCTSIIDLIETPRQEQEQGFSECARSISNSLEIFTDSLMTNVSENKMNSELYWNKYREYRDMCKLVKEVQSDIICSVCMSAEISTAFSCGHTFCTACSSVCHACPNCRVPITQKIKLFF